MLEFIIKLFIIFLLIILIICIGIKIYEDILTTDTNANNSYESFINVIRTDANNIIDQNNKINNENSNKDCYQLLPLDCIKCSQCGIFGKEGKYKCVPGDIYGPSFEYDADEWIYGNDRDEYLFGNTVVNKYLPWNKDIIVSLPDPLVMAS